MCLGFQAMCLAKPQAVAELQALLGCFGRRWPGSLRAQYATGRGRQNAAVLGSLSEEHARNEIAFFFAGVPVDPPLMDRAEQWRFLNTYVYPTLMDGVYQMCKRKPDDAPVELAAWLVLNNPNLPTVSCGMRNEQLFREIDEMKAELDCFEQQMREMECGAEDEPEAGGDTLQLEYCI